MAQHSETEPDRNWWAGCPRWISPDPLTEAQAKSLATRLNKNRGINGGCEAAHFYWRSTTKAAWDKDSWTYAIPEGAHRGSHA